MEPEVPKFPEAEQRDTQAGPTPPTAKEFCLLMTQARQYRLKGWWEGMSSRLKPHGIIRNNIVFCSENHPNDYCAAEVVLDPDSGFLQWCRNPNFDGDPYPRPRRGGVMRVYNSGNWDCEDGPWRQKLTQTLQDVRDEIAAIVAADAEKVEAAARAAREAAAARMAAAREAMELKPSEWNTKEQLPTWDDVGRRVELDLGIGARAIGKLDVTEAFREGERERLIFAVFTDDGREVPFLNNRRWRFFG